MIGQAKPERGGDEERSMYLRVLENVITGMKVVEGYKLGQGHRTKDEAVKIGNNTDLRTPKEGFDAGADVTMEDEDQDEEGDERMNDKEEEMRNKLERRYEWLAAAERIILRAVEDAGELDCSIVSLFLTFTSTSRYQASISPRKDNAPHLDSIRQLSRESFPEPGYSSQVTGI
jgi:hypothetical protein